MTDIFLPQQIELVPIEKLKRWEGNPRVNEAAIEPVAKSIKAYGMLVPICINGDYDVMAGDTRLQACISLGMTKVPCVRADHLTEDQQRAFNIADNKLGEIATWDQDLLRGILSGLQKSFEGSFDFSTIGFQPAETELILNGWQSNAQRVGDVPSDDKPSPGKIIIECPQETEEQLRADLQSFVSEMKIDGIQFR